jgi:inner membrane protein
VDSLTQIVLGAATAELIVGKKIGNRALLYGGIIGTIPDLDVFVGMAYDIVTANEIHRGFSHSILFFLLAAPLLGLILQRLERGSGVKLWTWIHVSFWCLLTHALLDAFTNWGTQLLWPWDKKFAIQSIFVIDPLYTLPFIYCLIRVMRLKRQDIQRRKWNLYGILISSFYLILTVGLQAIAKDRFQDELSDSGIEYNKISVRPAPLTAILWNANISAKDGYYLGEYSFFDTKPIRFSYFKRNNALIEGYIDDPMIRRLTLLSEGWYALTEQDGEVYFNDLRFGLLNDDPQKPEFVFRYLLKFQQGKIRAYEAKSPLRKEPKKLLIKLWYRIGGN